MWSVVWIAAAMIFNGGVATLKGHVAGLQFLTGYLLEKSLSVDNLFVFLLIFSYFNVPKPYQHKVLFWGILGAMVIRMIFIFLGVALITHFHAIIYFFGAFLIYTGFKLMGNKESEIHPGDNPLIKIFKRFFSVTENYEGDKFFIKKNSRWMATPLFIVLIVIETTDIVFAVDSIPAILAITTDPFIVFTSNIFAILGLRSLYFALSGLMKLFHYLHYGLAGILVFVGLKMLLSFKYHIPIGWALGVIAFTLTLSVVASVVFPEKKEENPPVSLA